MHSKRYLPSFIAALSFVLLELFLSNPSLILAVVSIIDILLIVSVWRMAKDSMIDKRWWNYAILPVIFFDSLVSYSVLLPYKSEVFFMQAIVILNALFIYYYLRSVFYHQILPTAERKTSLENVSSFGNFLSFFFISAVSFGLESFLNVPVWPIIMAIAILSFLLTYQMLLAAKVSMESGIVYTLISSLVLSELAWSMFYLPFNFNVSGLIFAIDYFVLIGLLLAYLKGRLDAKILKLYLGLGLALITIVLITSRWI